MTKMLRDEIPLNPHVAGLPPYNAGMNIAAAQKHSGRQYIAALASNEPGRLFAEGRRRSRRPQSGAVLRPGLHGAAHGCPKRT